MQTVYHASDRTDRAESGEASQASDPSALSEGLGNDANVSPAGYNLPRSVAKILRIHADAKCQPSLQVLQPSDNLISCLADRRGQCVGWLGP